MYCFKCGRQIRNDSIFCQYCGTKQDNTFNSVSVSQPNTVRESGNSGDLDREALKIYLHNVLSLECIKANNERKIADFTCNIREARKYTPYIKSYDALPKERYIIGAKYYVDAINKTFYFRYDGVLCFYGYSSRMVPNDCFNNEGTWWRVENDSDIDHLKKANESNWNYYADSSAGFLVKREQWSEVRNSFFRAYAEFKAEAPDIYNNTLLTNAINIDNWQQQIDGIAKELEEIAKLLTEAYSINIIPSQFRNNIHAIYYLHDFVSTSSESLTTALLHFDLDAIKAELDKSIAQQESVIIQNAFLIAQNEELSKQNQQQLEQLSRIESNSNQAAQYAQIAASNANTCAWIVANYMETH